MNRNSYLIEADELQKNLEKDKLRIYDATLLFFRKASDPTAYDRYLEGHIPGAAFFDHQKFSDPDSPYMYMVASEAELAAQIGDIGISEDTEVILYASGMLPSATRAWWVLRYAGHNHVRVLNGGLAAWKKAGGTIEQGERRYAPTKFKSRLRPGMFSSKEDVLAAIENGKVCTSNTLSLESYEAAHIVGSTCLPVFELMEEMQSFLPDDQLADRLKEEAQYKRIITYCGGGIAATVNAMAHLMAGHENVAVYDGSMSEWVAEDLPTARTGAGNWAVWG